MAGHRATPARTRAGRPGQAADLAAAADRRGHLVLDRAGCAWRYLPAGFPPWQTVYGYFARWREDGTLARLHDALRAGYATSRLAAWGAALKMTVQIVAKRDRHVIEVPPRRRAVERTFAWISKHRRTVRDYEHLPASHEAMILRAMIAPMTPRLAQPTELPHAH
jgi:transposase